jgi:hypothetical protein
VRQSQRSRVLLAQGSGSTASEQGRT